ncbi:MAG TPA: phenylalanine--tRNA ligase subunit beta [Leucothrix mucor]|uniref:Phenylalanine--tRNA ligase beta subunit n=1 Tax=Leucothrix mucor TaxID=45248 RepID=A0A7V2T479_LEUMU|nr:phenylalanine--tRNA ligase subunit beta [Leucothrix mucor]
MKVSEKWLREWVHLDATTEEIEHQLIMSGTELDGIEPVASAFTQVVVGQIKQIEQHPDADRLRVCQVDVAGDALLQIVTNATVEVDQKVPLAMIGAKLPESDGNIFKIKKSKLRGVLSQGMFCGSETLGMGEAGKGLLAIPSDATLGADLREVLGLDDVILDLDATPNRADLLCIAGVARELGVILQAPVQEVDFELPKITIDDVFPVKISADDLCQRYAGRVIRDVNTQAETPLWMVEKLRRSDIRSLSPVVDITNYVMLELGQPMHGFDFDTLEGGIHVRNAEEGEKLTLLDGKEATLRADTLVIADEKKALALAGIMGGADSAVSESTSNIYLESAYFVPEKMMGKARTYGLHTDSSHRFERGVSPDLQRKAMQRATQLIIEICGGKAGEITDIETREDLQHRNTIAFKRSSIKRHLGIEVEDSRVEDIMTRLGCNVETAKSGWYITPPIFRFDLATQEDVVEEIARIYGYDNIPSRLRPLIPLIIPDEETQVEEETLRNLLVTRGYQEAITYSFVPPEMETLLNPSHKQITLDNPISEELSIMRSTLWSGLLPVIEKNLKRQQSRVRLFETGLSFVNNDEGMSQRKKMAGAITGLLYPEHWDKSPQLVDFYDIKGDVEALLSESNAENYQFEAVEHPALHPGQAAKIVSNNQIIGFVGALHPRIEKKFGLSQPVFLFELDMDMIRKKNLPNYSSLSPYPSIRRDIALVIDQQVNFSVIEKIIKKAEIKQLVGYSLFDVYHGAGIEVGQKSLALGLIFQDFSRTLEEKDITQYVDGIVDSLKAETGASLR